MDRAIGDASPPTTILVSSMDFFFDGNNGNNNYAAKDYTFKLSSTDSYSGVERIKYSIDWSPFTPFSGVFSLDTKGPHSIVFKAADNLGIREVPKTVTVIVDDSPPAAPCGLSGEQVDFNINLSWTPNSEADLSGYNLYRDGIKIKTYMVYNTSHSEPLISGKTYKYNITAIDHVGNESDFSNTFPITTLSIPPAITSLVEGALYVDEILTVRGTAEMGSYVEIFVNAISQGTTLASNTGHFSLSGVSLSDGENAISARSTNSYGVTSNESMPVFIYADLRPQPPAGLAASPGDTVADITWNANPEPDIQGYHIYRGKIRLNHALLRETSYKDILLINGRTYGYTVTAVDNNGSESYLSTPVTVTPVAGFQWEIPDF